MNVLVGFDWKSSKEQRAEAWDKVLKTLDVVPAPGSFRHTRFDIRHLLYVYEQECIPAGAGHHWHGTTLN